MALAVAPPKVAKMVRLASTRSFRTTIHQLGKKSKPSDAYRSTVLLPATSFPARLEGDSRVAKDREVVESERHRSLYARQRGRKRAAGTFTLHDGPPYANGEPHLGHAVNKVLKDVINRSRVVAGWRVDYRPGWDCHGLPIELKVQQLRKKEGRADGRDPLSVREEADGFAKEAVAGQAGEFASWAVMADWERPYLTSSPDFVKRQLRLFGRLLERGLAFRRYMPVYWSPSSGTALAESELEYNQDHVSRAVHVRFRLTSPSADKILEGKEGTTGDVHLVIWTTTPWSLVANRAVCVSPDATYLLVRNLTLGGVDVVAKKLFEGGELQKVLPADQALVLGEVAGSALCGLEYCHPLSAVVVGEEDSVCPVLPGGHVTLDAGTGLVHTAPAHGPDDYMVGVEHSLDLGCPVDEEGRFFGNLAGGLAGLEALTEGTERVLEALRGSGHLLLEEDYVHSYPYDWRTKKPVLLRASKQWFVDVASLRGKALEALKAVEIKPESAKSGFLGVLEKRPYWLVEP